MGPYLKSKGLYRFKILLMFDKTINNIRKSHSVTEHISCVQEIENPFLTTLFKMIESI